MALCVSIVDSVVVVFFVMYAELMQVDLLSGEENVCILQ